MEKGFCDIHNHFLYGIDDGPADIGGTVNLIEQAYDDGIRTLYSTPHVRAGLLPFDYNDYMEKISKITEMVNNTHPDMEIMTGAELLYTQRTPVYLRDGLIPTLNGSNKILVEFNINISFDELKGGLQKLLSSGYVPILAHVERYECMFKHIKRYFTLKEMADVYYQVNASTITEHNDFSTKRFISKLFGAQLIDFIATDAHDQTSRPACLSKAYEKIASSFSLEYADKLTRSNVE